VTDTQLQVRIRPARENDAEKLFELLAALTVTYEPSRTAFDENLPRLIESDREALLVAESEEGVVGYAMAAESMTLYANGPVVDLLELIVEERLRGQGIGEKLVNAVKAWGREHGCLDLNVATRRSGSYYEHLGFSETATFYRLQL
jgi:N-acetylglutamate synthase-like GNAT family acetyltransferase